MSIESRAKNLSGNRAAAASFDIQMLGTIDITLPYTDSNNLCVCGRV